MKYIDYFEHNKINENDLVLSNIFDITSHSSKYEILYHAKISKRIKRQMSLDFISHRIQIEILYIFICFLYFESSKISQDCPLLFFFAFFATLICIFFASHKKSYSNICPHFIVQGYIFTSFRRQKIKWGKGYCTSAKMIRFNFSKYLIVHS